MGHDLLRRVTKTSVITGLLLFWVFVVYWDVAAGVGWLLGCAWSLVNLFFLALLVRTMMSRGPNRRLRLGLILMVKVPVLYGIGFVLLAGGWVPLVALLAGFVWPLLVITLKLLGRALLRMDDRQRVLDADAPLIEKRLHR